MSRQTQLAEMARRRAATLDAARAVIEAQRAAEAAARPPITTPYADLYAEECEAAGQSTYAYGLLASIEQAVALRKHRATLHVDIDPTIRRVF